MSREDILQRIRENKPSSIELPVLPGFASMEEGKAERFSHLLHSIGGRCTVLRSGELESFMQGYKGPGLQINGWSRSAGYNLEQFADHKAEQLRELQTVFLEGSIGVSENGAVWVPEKNMKNRLLPFICQQLVLFVHERDIVPTLHEAYRRIHIQEDGYGVFIAGPSKTADIEQSLVVGAHGPLSMEVVVVNGGT